MSRSRIVRAAALCVAVACLAWVPGSGPVAAAPSSIERKPPFTAKVNAAIAGGVKGLLARQQQDGGWEEYPGHRSAVTALVYHTVRVCGTAADDPAAVRAYDALRKEWADTTASQRGTYTTALVMMAIAEHGRPLASAQGERTIALDDRDTLWMKELVAILEKRQTNEGMWGYGGGPGRDRADHSNTQYALLGLKAAARCGVAVKTTVWARSLAHFVGCQEKNGPDVIQGDPGAKKKSQTAAIEKDRARGWGYTGGDGAYGSMTAAGVASVVICRSELLAAGKLTDADEAKSERSVRDGLAWLGHHFTVTADPLSGNGVWHNYYLYGLERAGVLAGVDWMGARDWYGEGAEHLLEMQLDDGLWRPELNFPGLAGRRGVRVSAGPGEPVDSCFALLFLKRGTAPVKRGAITQGAGDEDLRFEGAESLDGVAFSDLLDLVLSRWRRTSDQALRTRLFDRAVTMGPRLVPALLVRMCDPELARRDSASQLLKRATGEDLGFDPQGSAASREEALSRWEVWWMSNSRSLRYDAEAKRLIRS